MLKPELCALEESERVSICEVLDRVLNKGVVVAGEVTISVADVDLLYLGLNLVLTSIETARGMSWALGKQGPVWQLRSERGRPMDAVSTTRVESESIRDFALVMQQDQRNPTAGAAQWNSEPGSPGSGPGPSKKTDSDNLSSR